MSDMDKLTAEQGPKYLYIYDNNISGFINIKKLTFFHRG